MRDERPGPGDELDEGGRGEPTNESQELPDALLADLDDDAAEALAQEDWDDSDEGGFVEAEDGEENDDEARGFFEGEADEEHSSEERESEEPEAVDEADDGGGEDLSDIDAEGAHDPGSAEEVEHSEGDQQRFKPSQSGEAKPGASPATGHSTAVTGATVGRDLTVIGQLINKKDKGRFLPVEHREWLEVEPTFVASAECADHVDGGHVFRQGRVLVLCGAVGTGKRTCTLHLAEQSGYLTQATTFTYRYHSPTGSEAPSLIEVLSDPETPSQALLILENAFESRNADRELTGSSLAALLGLLNDGSRCLLLTTSRERRDLPDSVEVLSAELDAKRLEILRSKALEHRWPRGGPLADQVKKLIVDSWKTWEGTLDRSGRILDFVRRVAAAEAKEINTLEKLEVVAEEVVAPRPWGLSQWFTSLEGNDLLMAFLILFFPDLVAADLMTLYVQSVHRLRQDGVGVLADPRGQGIDDLLFKLRISQSEGPLKFDVLRRTDFVSQQVANHRHLLLSLAELLLENFERLPGRNGWPLRKGLGTLIGHLGVYDESWMKSRLIHLALESGWQQKTVATYALVRLAEEDLRTSKDRALAIAGGWAVSGPELRWTAGASLWRIFELFESRRRDIPEGRIDQLQDRVIGILKQIMTQKWDRGAIQEARKQARSDPQRKAGHLLYGWRFYPVLHALVRCLQEGPKGVVPHIVGWLSSEEEGLPKELQKDLRNVALQACEVAYEEPPPDLAESFGRLALAFFTSTDPSNQTLRRIFRRLQAKLVEKDLAGEFFCGLLSVCWDGGELRRGRLRRILAETWTDTPEARALAAQLVARSHALDGRFVAPLQLGRAVLIYDPSIAVHWQRPVLRAGEEEPRKWQEGNETHVVRQLASLLSARFELRLGVLGRVRTWTLDDPLSPLLQRGSRFPLLLPVLEEIASWNPDLTVVVYRGPVMDLEDLEGHPAADRLILVSVAESDPEEEVIPDWHLAGGLTERRLEELEEVLEEHWSTAKREAPAAAWEPLTKHLGISSQLTVEEHEAALREACRPLLDPAEAGGPDDLVHCLCGAFMAWAARDLPAAVDVLARWLDPEGAVVNEEEPAADGEPSSNSGKTEPSNESRVAAAATKALYRLYRGAALEPGDDRALLFDRLAWPLSVADADGVATVLRAVKGWLANSGWREHLASHGTANGSGRGRLLRWAERFLPGRAQELAELLPSRSADEPEKELLSDLLQTLAGGPTYRPWPALAPGQRRGLVVPDSLSPSGAGGVALRLARRLQRDSPDTVPTIVCLGEVRPVWVPGSHAWSETDRASPPRLLVPLLECAEVHPDSVAFVVVLTSGPILDEADLLHSPWWPKIQVVPLAASQAPQGLRWLIPDGAVVVGRPQEAEELLFEMLIDGLDRGGLAVAGPPTAAN